jgi:hypothetical protein
MASTIGSRQLTNYPPSEASRHLARDASRTKHLGKGRYIIQLLDVPTNNGTMKCHCAIWSVKPISLKLASGLSPRRPMIVLQARDAHGRCAVASQSCAVRQHLKPRRARIHKAMVA